MGLVGDISHSSDEVLKNLCVALEIKGIVGENVDPRCCSFSCLSVLGHEISLSRSMGLAACVSMLDLLGTIAQDGCRRHRESRGAAGTVGLWSRGGTCQRQQKRWPGRRRHTGSKAVSSEAVERGTGMQCGLEVFTHGSGTWSSLSYCPTESLPHSRAWEDKSTWHGGRGANGGM